MMRPAAVVWLLTALPLVASAAEVTRTASSFDDGHPFGMFVDVDYQRTEHDGVLTREAHGASSITDTKELNYRGVDSRMSVDLHVGLWKGLELSIGIPVIFSQTDSYSFAAGRNAGNSPLLHSCVQANGSLYDPGCFSSGAGAQPMTGNLPYTSYRTGLGNLHLGLSYAILRQSVDPSTPTWTVSFKYDIPTASRRDPAAITSASNPTGVGDKVNRYIFGTAFSRRLGIADPYVRFTYTLPFRGPDFYSNCDRSDLSNLAAPDNCNTPGWSRADTGINAPHEFSLSFGTELVPLENRSGQRIAIDFRGTSTYYTAGRYYNEATPLFRKLMSSDGYLEVGGSVALIAQPASWITLRLRGSYSFQTDHNVSGERLGKDLNGDGAVTYAGSPAPELNPTYDYRVDPEGRRLRIIDNGVWALNVSASLNF